MKLTATEFTYTMIDAIGRRKEHRGSYLGRKAATRETIRRFIRHNGGARFKARVVSIDSAYLSQWIAR